MSRVEQRLHPEQELRSEFERLVREHNLDHFESRDKGWLLRIFDIRRRQQGGNGDLEAETRELREKIDRMDSVYPYCSCSRAGKLIVRRVWYG